jgi:hypothetical protein
MSANRPFLLVFVLAMGCQKGATDTTDTDVADTDVDVPPPMVATIAGDVTWSVDFGATSEAAGATDCAYTRTYTGVEDRSAPWLCPTCEDLFQVSVALSGRECYDQISSSAPLDSEWLGYVDGNWYRAAGSPLTLRGPATLEGGSLTVTQHVDPADSGGDWALDIAGTLTIGEQEGDPRGEFVPPDTYACGWPKADPAPYSGDYVATVGATLPDGAFDDVCDEPVRLHDFAGNYFVVDISAVDCPPCQSAASSEEDFVSSMAAEGIDVHVVTLLAPSLSDTAGTPTHAQLQAWIDAYDVASPVLADRIWGLATTGARLGDDFGYPTFLVVDPDLKIVDIEVGFGGWDAIAGTIRGD